MRHQVFFLTQALFHEFDNFHNQSQRRRAEPFDSCISLEVIRPLGGYTCGCWTICELRSICPDYCMPKCYMEVINALN